MTPAELEAFQRSHSDHFGRPLRVDGVVGPRTEWALDFATLARERRELVSAAQLYIGLAEDPPGSNDEPSGTIRAWLGRCGAALGDPWCAAFASWCISQGLGKPVRCAGALALGKRFPPTMHPVAGDLFWFPTGGGHGHCGLVLGTAPLEVMTIEGNCKNAVRCVLRDRAALEFCRTVDDNGQGTAPGIVADTPRAPVGTR